MAASGDVAVIGARLDDDDGSASGSAYVYGFDGTDWVEEQKLLASDGAAGDQFGSSVAVSGGAAAIGALDDDDDGSSSGSAYVYGFDGTDWVEEQKLLASDGAAGDQFGVSVSVSGSVVVVGALGDDDNGSFSGSAYVFALPTPVVIDIKPGNINNRINLSAGGVIPVAILGSDSFDVMDVDPDTLAFGPSGAALAHVNGPHFDDVNGDSFTDLLAHFRTQQTGIVSGDLEACLTGETFAAVPFEACDDITAVPCGMGIELALLLPPLMWLHRRRRLAVA